ncbi:glycosyltransferase involved in cell wall biosynthesis [Roseiarcus fermentans]|uniref:Glycosyltransferase involved in cell wall biosynthesis n=1 Tax=Roseiarcus fermentans TaxID=1473586 RepID=A0A366FPY1_9HYPH|nr:glycosyltransferase [Roseiarcus fermentans]RBP16100.1 glycosyltransferase involved in cell wall biosynthesis [Roseiarcus fermentans]
MKTIGYVLGDFPVLSETFVGNEIRAMAKRGHEVVPIVMRLREGPAQTADRILARDARTLSSVSAGAALGALARPGRNPASALGYLLSQKRQPRKSLLWNAMKIAAIAREAGCDHLHAHFAGGAAAHAIVAARWIGISVSFVCHGHDVYAEPEDLPIKLGAADAVVAVCKDMESDLRRLAPSSKVTTIHCGTDPEVFRPVHDVDPLPRLLFVGRLIPCKGVDDLLSALAIQGTAAVDIVGDGPLMNALRERAQALGVAERVNFLGARPREWLVENGPRYFGLVAPFKQGPDGTKDTGPLVIKEAMAMGLPVVATRQMGIKEMISPETGFFADPADPSSLAEAIGRLLRLSPIERSAMGRRGRERVIERFSLDASSRALSQVFEAA